MDRSTHSRGYNGAMSEDDHPARAASRRSMDCVIRHAKDEWLALFAEDGVVADPVGPSPFDEAGTGHHGKEAIAAFWDATIATVERFEFLIHDSFAAGDEVANVGTIVSHLPGGMSLRTDGVFVYRVGDDGLLRSLRAFWEWDRAMATLATEPAEG
jgi:ketosteroid isomerase-like protein